LRNCNRAEVEESSPCHRHRSTGDLTGDSGTVSSLTGSLATVPDNARELPYPDRICLSTRASQLPHLHDDPGTRRSGVPGAHGLTEWANGIPPMMLTIAEKL
jgi:hypothetical protein